MLKSKSLKITFILFFFSVLANAQNGKDSIYIFRQDKQLIENMLFSPTFSNSSTLTSYGYLQLDFEHETGGLRRAQEAFKISKPKFLAKGFNILGRFRIAGSFEFNKSFEDSLANGQRNNLDEFNTFYAYANKSGNYERQNYIIKTSISYSTLNNRLFPFINLDYQKSTSTGSLDPRLSSNRFIFKLKPGINLSLKKQNIGIYGLLGKADEQTNIQYKNSDFKNSLLFPDRIHYMNYGYGSSVIKDSSTVLRYDNYRGFGIQYATVINKWKLQLAGEYEHYLNKNHDRKKSTKGFHTVGEFNLNTISSNLLLSKRNENNSQQIALAVTYNDGYDGNLKTSGSLNRVNYKINSLSGNGSYHYLWDKSKKTSKELGVIFQYNQNDKQDLGQANGLAYEQIQFILNGNLYHKIDVQSMLKLSIAPYYISPLKTMLKYNPNSLTEFIRNVVFTDYYFFNSKIVGANISAEYISSKLIKNQQFGLYFQLDYSNQLKQDLRADLNPTFIPNNNRTIYHLGINMYL